MSLSLDSEKKTSSWAIILHPKILKKRRLEILVSHFLELQKKETQLFPLATATKWSHFIKNLHQKSQGVPKPFCAVKNLVEKYLHSFNSSNPVLDIGCETGKNAMCLAQASHRVTLLDISPLAIQYTLENLEKKELSHKVAEAIVGKIEDLDQNQGLFKAVVGTYAFSFISPELFQKVMKKNVLGRIESGGYFAGGFFGPEHAWSESHEISIVTVKKLTDFLTSKGFSVCEIKEKKETQQTISKNLQLFHTIEVIAKKLIS